MHEVFYHPITKLDRPPEEVKAEVQRLLEKGEWSHWTVTTPGGENVSRHGDNDVILTSTDR